jgi:transposase-like protein
MNVCPECGADEPIEILENIDPGVDSYLCLVCEATWIWDSNREVLIK